MKTTRPGLSRLALTVATGAAVVLAAHPSSAAAKPFTITDPTGDANGLNSQGGFPLPVPNQSTPADLSGADITKVELATVFKKVGKKQVANGFDVTLRLAAPLQQGVLYTITMNTSRPCGDSSVIQLGYSTESKLATCQAGSGTAANIGTWAVAPDQKSITWQLDNLFKAGTKIDTIRAWSSVFVLGVFDEATTDNVFTYGK